MLRASRLSFPEISPGVKEPAADFEATDSPPPGSLNRKSPGALAADSRELPDIWGRLFEIIAREHPALGGNLANAKLLKVTPEKVVLEVSGNQFNINRLRKRENSARLATICSAFFKRQVTVEVRADVERQKKGNVKIKLDNQMKQDVLSHPLIEDAIEIFQGEVIEVRSLAKKQP